MAVVLSSAQEETQGVKKSEESGKYSPNKRKDKTPGIDFNEMEICDIPNKQFKIMITNMFINIRRKMHEQSKFLNREKI